MSDWEPVHLGKSGAKVWRGRGVHRKVGDPAEIAAEAARLQWLGDHGIPCPRVVDCTPGVLVTTTLAGNVGTADWPQYLYSVMVNGLADLLQALHSLHYHECPFDRSLAVAIPLAEQAVHDNTVCLDDLDPEHEGWSARQLLEELHRTRPASESLVVGHGDPTLSNVLFDERGQLTGVIDVARMGVADRYNDLAITTRDLEGEWGAPYASQLLQKYGIGPDAADEPKIRFYRLLDEFF